MHPFQITMLISSATLACVAAFFLVIRSFPTRPGINWWVTASISQSVMYIVAYMCFNKTHSLVEDALFFTLQLISYHACGLGLMRFLVKKVNYKRRATALVLTLLAIYASEASGHRFLTLTIIGVHSSICLLQPVFTIYKLKRRRDGYTSLMILLSLMAIHMLDYPFLRGIEWFAPFGMFLAVILIISIYFHLAYITLIQFKFSTQKSEAKAIQSSITDPLTKLYNRSHLDQLFEEHCELAASNENSFNMLYLDLDGFKSINDTYGHKAGDYVLIIVAKRLKNWLGNKGSVVRIGGDEFIIVYKLGSTTQDTDIVRNQIQDILTELEKPIIHNKEMYHISASIGSSHYTQDTSLEKMIQQSDKMMYIAKHARAKENIDKEEHTEHTHSENISSNKQSKSIRQTANI